MNAASKDNQVEREAQAIWRFLRRKNGRLVVFDHEGESWWSDLYVAQPVNEAMSRLLATYNLPDWVFDLRDRTRCVTCNGRGSWPAFTRQVCPGCGATGRGATAFFFKQWGALSPDGCRIGKTAAGRLLGRRTWDEYPVERTTTQETP